MKKSVIIVILFGSLLGYLFGSLIFKNYDGNKYYKENGNIYYIQYGVYTSNEVALSNVEKLSNYKIIEDDEKYYVYLGITSNYDNALKIQKMYQDQEIYTYIRSDYVKNSELLTKLQEYDDILQKEDTNIVETLNEILNNTDLTF